MTIFRKFITALTTRPAFLDKSKRLQADFDNLPESVRFALRGHRELPADAVQAMVDHDDRFTRAAAEIAARKKTITVESNVTVDLDR